jgi:hypothetical protein
VGDVSGVVGSKPVHILLWRISFRLGTRDITPGMRALLDQMEFGRLAPLAVRYRPTVYTVVVATAEQRTVFHTRAA